MGAEHSCAVHSQTRSALALSEAYRATEVEAEGGQEQASRHGEG